MDWVTPHHFNQVIQEKQRDMGQYKSPYTGSPATHSHRPVCHQPPSSHHYNLRNHTPPPSYPIFWPERDCILTEDNLISVRERREAKHWRRTCNTSTDGESHDLWKKSVWSLCMCTCVCTRGQWLTGTMDNKTFNSLFHRLPCQQSRPANGQNYSLFQSTGELHVLLEKSSSEAHIASLQLINRVITFCLQQWWLNFCYTSVCLLFPQVFFLQVSKNPYNLRKIQRKGKISLWSNCSQLMSTDKAIICDEGCQIETDFFGKNAWEQLIYISTFIAW